MDDDHRGSIDSDTRDAERESERVDWDEEKVEESKDNQQSNDNN